MNGQEITVLYRWTAKPGRFEELRAIYDDVLKEMKANEPGTLEMECYVADLGTDECNLTDQSAPWDWRLPTRADWIATHAPVIELGCRFTLVTGLPSLQIVWWMGVLRHCKQMALGMVPCFRASSPTSILRAPTDCPTQPSPFCRFLVMAAPTLSAASVRVHCAGVASKEQRQVGVTSPDPSTSIEPAQCVIEHRTRCDAADLLKIHL